MTLILTPSLIKRAVEALEAEQTEYAKSRDYTAKEVWRKVLELKKKEAKP